MHHKNLKILFRDTQKCCSLIHTNNWISNSWLCPAGFPWTLLCSGFGSLFCFPFGKSQAQTYHKEKQDLFSLHYLCSVSD